MTTYRLTEQYLSDAMSLCAPRPGRPLIVEPLAIAAFVLSLGCIAAVWLDGWGGLLAVMVLGGIAAPLLLRRGRTGAPRPVWIASSLVLLGGLVLRAVIIFSSDRL